MSDSSTSAVRSDHGDPHAHDNHAHDAHAHGGSIKTYLAVFVALCVLTTGSFLTWTDWWHTAVGNKHVAWSFMMAISCTKALLVILFFMHLKYEANWKYVLTIPAGFMSIFLMLMLVPDIGMRFWHYSRDRLEFCAVPEQVSEHGAQATHPANAPESAAPQEKSTPHP